MTGFQHHQESVSMKQTLQVSKQGVCFIMSYLLIFLLSAVDMLSTATPPPWFYVLLACVFPLQGLFNAFVYFRPRFADVRKRQGEGGSKTKAIFQVLDITVPSLARFSGIFGRS